MNSDLEKEKNFETGDPSLQNTVMEVRRLKEKLEQMLLDQELPPGSGASNIEAAIDDLTAAHSETNVKLGRLDELKKKEHSIEETEKKLGETLEAITKHEEELNSVKQSMGEDAERLEEQRKIIQEAEEGIEYHKNTYNKLLEDEKEQEENEFQASSIDDSFVDEEDVHYPKERVEEAEEDYARLVDTSDENEIRAGLEAAAEQEATEAEEAALAEGATQEEQHDAYKTVINDFHSRYSFGEDHTYVKNDLEDEEEGIYAAQELKEKAEDDITKTQVNLSKLGAQHGEISSSLNQAQKDYESARKIAANMKLERDQLKNDIVTNLGPLVEKINKLYGDFISAKKSNQVVEKSNKVKNELEELKKELSSTDNQIGEHKELVQHGKIKRLTIKISNIDQMLQDLTIKHDKILEELGEIDDRNTSEINLEEYVPMKLGLVVLGEARNYVRSFFIQRFNIPETKLVTNSEKQRLNLEVDLAILRQHKKLLNKDLRLQESNVAYLEYMQMDKMRGKQEFKIRSFGKGSLESLTIPKPPPDALQYMTGTNVEPPTIQPDQTLVQEFTWISTLETEFRKLIADIFKNINNWWVDLVPDDIRDNARNHNNRNPDFLERQKTQDFGLLEFVNFNSLPKIFTGVKCWEYFSPVFPKLVGYNENSWFDSLKNKFRDTCYCRNRISHNNRLDEMNHDTLKVNYSFFVKCIEDFRNR